MKASTRMSAPSSCTVLAKTGLKSGWLTPLHRSGREAEFVAGDHFPVGDESFHEQLLNGVAVLHAQVRHVLGEWVDGCSRATSLIQGVGEILRLLPVQ